MCRNPLQKRSIIFPGVANGLRLEEAHALGIFYAGTSILAASTQRRENSEREHHVQDMGRHDAVRKLWAGIP